MKNLLQYRRINGPGTIFQACLCPLSERFGIYRRNILGTSSLDTQMKYFIYIYFHKALHELYLFRSKRNYEKATGHRKMQDN